MSTLRLLLWRFVILWSTRLSPVPGMPEPTALSDAFVSVPASNLVGVGTGGRSGALVGASISGAAGRALRLGTRCLEGSGVVSGSILRGEGVRCARTSRHLRHQRRSITLTTPSGQIMPSGDICPHVSRAIVVVVMIVLVVVAAVFAVVFAVVRVEPVLRHTCLSAIFTYALGKP